MSDEHSVLEVIEVRKAGVPLRRLVRLDAQLPPEGRTS